MNFFEHFFGVDGDKIETPVCCPFPHSAGNSTYTYYEQRPSAHFNTETRVFNCKVCGAGYNEMQFIRAVLGCSYADAVKLLQRYAIPEQDYYEWCRGVVLKESVKDEALRLGISERVISELNLGQDPYDHIAFPVFVHNKLLDIRVYNPGANLKICSLKGSASGLIIPYDVWRTSDKERPTIVCAGEKDMAIARSMGFNAITITGGEGALPIFLKEFNDRDVVIAYDNDKAGKDGALKLANYLQEHAKSVKNCVGFHEVCSNEGEDITDFFMKYKKNKQDLINYIEATAEHEYIELANEKKSPIVDLHTASRADNLNKIVRSNIQVVATSETTFVVPSVLVAAKMAEPRTGEKLQKNETRDWYLTEDTVQDILHMIDNNFKEETIRLHYKDILKILRKESYVKISKPTKETVYKCYVTDLFETDHLDAVPMEYTAYSIGTKLENGKKYLATYKLVPHPYKGQQLIMLIMEAKEANDSVSDFKLNDKAKADLEYIRKIPGTVPEKINDMVERVKDILGYDGNNTLITTMDLAYHTPLQFNFGNFKNERAYIDALIVGESRMGKSSTGEALRQTYKLGVFTSLAGNAATIPGLVGGSSKQAGGNFQTRAGLIPQNHRGLLIFEELSKSKRDVVAELTDIRSSNEVRITRVSGNITMPALVRMITLSNIKHSGGAMRSIASYPNGIEVLKELVQTPEDIARYDIALVLGDRGNSEMDPLWKPPQKLPDATYLTRIRWVWSRTAEQILMSETVQHYIVAQANILNKIYGGHIKIFGTEAWKKISRIAIAAAGYCVSTDETYNVILVTKEHVDFAVNYLKNIYDNDVFRLKEFIEHEKQYSTIDEDGVKLLQDVYNIVPQLLLYLEQVSKTSRATLQAATGLENDKYNAQMSKLIKGLFIKFEHHDILPTEKFRLGMAKITRRTSAPKIGELR